MSPTICPGQDTRFWQASDVFEVECAECGYEIEFFKDDTQRRCRKCGTRVVNPRLSLGCAQWCEHAEKCLGYDPKKSASAEGGEAQAITDRILEILRRDTGNDETIMAEAVGVLELAEEILKTEQGDPRIILAAALLSNAGDNLAQACLNELNLPPDTRDSILETIRVVKQGLDAKNTETVILADARRLYHLSGDQPDEDSVKLLTTDFAKQVAQKMDMQKTP